MTLDEIILSEAIKAMKSSREKYVGQGSISLLAPPWIIRRAKSYRAVVCLSWDLRARPRMTRKLLSEECGAHASHITDYLNPDPAAGRDLPAPYIHAFEKSLGNLAISQWLAFKAELPIQEEIRWLEENPVPSIIAGLAIVD